MVVSVTMIIPKLAAILSIFVNAGHQTQIRVLHLLHQVQSNFCASPATLRLGLFLSQIFPRNHKSIGPTLWDCWPGIVTHCVPMLEVLLTSTCCVVHSFTTLNYHRTPVIVFWTIMYHVHVHYRYIST